MASTTFTGPVQSKNGFNNIIVGATDPGNGTLPISSYNSIQVSLTNAQVLDLFDTPVTVIAAPGANKAILLDNVVIYKPAGTAFTIGSATNLTLGYDAGTALSGTVAVTGFADQATAQTRAVSSIITSITPAANTAITIRLAGADMTAGTTGLIVMINYFVVPTVLS